MPTATQEQLLPLYRPYAKALLADESGAEAEHVNRIILKSISSEVADWLFDGGWDEILAALQEESDSE